MKNLDKCPSCSSPIKRVRLQYSISERNLSRYTYECDNRWHDEVHKFKWASKPPLGATVKEMREILIESLEKAVEEVFKPDVLHAYYPSGGDFVREELKRSMRWRWW